MAETTEWRTNRGEGHPLHLLLLRIQSHFNIAPPSFYSAVGCSGGGGGGSGPGSFISYAPTEKADGNIISMGGVDYDHT